MNTITTEQLRQAKCQICGDKDPNCQDIVLCGKCHPQAGVKVIYEKNVHRLRISCVECDKLVIYLQFPTIN